MKKKEEPSGVILSYLDAAGREVFASESAIAAVLNSISAGGRSALTEQQSSDSASLCQCHSLTDKQNFRGIALQLYALRSEKDWGIGDFGTLSDLVPVLAEQGFDFIGLSPLHMTALGSKTDFSPYSPSSRIFYSPIYIDVDAAAALCDVEISHPEEGTFAEELINYEKVWKIKLRTLESIYEKFESSASDAVKQRFTKYRDSCDLVHQQTALFFAIQSDLQRRDSKIWGWPAWPKELHDINGKDVQQKRNELTTAVNYQLFLQWLCEEQLAELRSIIKISGMGLGLYTDLALGSSWGGADTWIWKNCFCAEMSCGAPPDELGPLGQDWGFAPFHPGELQRMAAEPFRLMVRSAMKYAGAVRLDHVMSLYRLFWIPRGMKAADGVYVRYPTDLLFDVVADESKKSRCIVIGEDLGTVPEEVRQQMEQRNVLSYKVVYFMRDAGGYFLPKDYPRRALAVISTHDLPTLRGFFEARDLRLRHDFKLFTDTAHFQSLLGKRNDDSAKLYEALRFLNLDPDRELKSALLNFLDSANSQLRCFQLEDILNLDDQMNLPGTLYEYPNWRRRYGTLPTKLQIESEAQ